MTPTPRSNPGQGELDEMLDLKEILAANEAAQGAAETLSDEQLIGIARRARPVGPFSAEVWTEAVVPALLQVLADRLEFSNRMVAAGRRAYAREIAERGRPQ